MASVELKTTLLLNEKDVPTRNLERQLKNAGFDVTTVEDIESALNTLKHGPFDVFLCPLQEIRGPSARFLGQARDLLGDGVLIALAPAMDLGSAGEALRAGADDYLVRPVAVEQILLSLKKLEEKEKIVVENSELRSALSQRYSFSNIIAHSQSMKNIFETVKRLANFNTTVMITGESGTGKELLALAIHHNSPRRGKPFVAINCGAIPENLMESELFGHKKGSFTDATRDKRGLLEEASGGTVFLDEVGEMPVHLQVKLLRALQEQQIRRVGDEQPINIDTRVIAATLRDIEEDVKSGRFRDDLFYRLNVVSIHIPPLRERVEDIPVLVQHFIKKHNKRLNLDVADVSPEAMKCMMQYRWRGNVRELENCIERAMVLTENNNIARESLPEQVQAAGAYDKPADENLLTDDNLSIKARTKTLEIGLIKKALQKTGGNRTHAAKILEISHRALLYKLKEYGLSNA